ncbi:PTS glucitol/sorbitol transporter subunit IIA [Sporolactobacillus shoreicorticis]|uniref:PTS glucitol/sorbitol transporter subunit IIA n=1 Tax=Sporolactobacillus shoreicorticis TaxID=1923877 RepID=A0ABW5S178_9BACL|nr:PTS glucitol/sorbitol transporter subunit IIA [Sporolactobacillus shoreicorticis]MCO7127238.1 PTS glucitol/sorbitol transporter subunit IIA [Sporolactobacillus shoreicorticis]
MFGIKRKSAENAVIYKTEIKSIGKLAKEFLQEKMLILFGNEAPEGLKDYCFGINVTSVHDQIQTGQYVSIDKSKFKITAVGRLVQKNLADLGHITMKFDGSTKANLAGTLYLESKPIPNIGIGTQIAIEW